VRPINHEGREEKIPMYLSFFFLALLLFCALGVVPPLLALLLMFLFTLIGLLNLSRPWTKDTFWE
jgi:hypothetical protein